MNFLVEQKRLHIAPSYKGGYSMKCRFIFFVLLTALLTSCSNDVSSKKFNVLWLLSMINLLGIRSMAIN